MSPKLTRRSSPRVKFFSISFCIAGESWMPGCSKNLICTISGRLARADVEARLVALALEQVAR